MDKDTFTLNNQTYSNNNNILLGIINELQQIANSSHENLTIKRISDVIIKMNFIIIYLYYIYNNIIYIN